MTIFSPSTPYYTLIGSLPALPAHFEDADRAPISELRLRERLTMLEDREAKIIAEMADFLTWERQPLELNDDDVSRRYDRFMAEIDDPFARELIERAMSNRRIVAGLRCRRLELDPPRGVSPIARHIAQNWSHPDFRLGSRFPWIVEVDALLNGESPFDVERKILEVAWQHVCRVGEQFDFTFEAVVVYLIRWEIVYRWTQQDADVGRERFDQLVQEAMGDYAEMFD